MITLRPILFNDPAIGRFEIKSTENYTIISVNHRDLYFKKDGTLDGTGSCLQSDCLEHSPIGDAEDPPYRIDGGTQ